MKQLTLTGITVRDEFENEMPYKATVKATIWSSEGEAHNDQQRTR